jgi:hypothetical protein
MRVTLTDFIRKLELCSVKYKIADYGDAIYVELEDDHLCFRFDRRGDLSGGWIRPYSSEREPEWKKWSGYLQ